MTRIAIVMTLDVHTYRQLSEVFEMVRTPWHLKDESKPQKPFSSIEALAAHLVEEGVYRLQDIARLLDETSQPKQ